MIAAIRMINALPESKDTPFRDPAMLDILPATALLNQGQFAAARALFLNALEGNLTADLRAQIAAGIATTYWWEGNIDDSIRYLAQAADALEVAIEDLPSQESLIAYLGSYRRNILDGLLEYQIENGRPEDAFGLAERARARAFLQQIGGGAGKSRSLIPVTPSGLTAIQGELPPNTSMIVYFFSPHRMHTWVLNRGNVHHVVRAMDSRTLDRIACWGWSQQFNRNSRLRTPVPVNSLDSIDQPRCRNQDDAATDPEVFEELIAPIEAHLLYQRLIIVPHGKLHQVPFAAIRDDRGYLVERFTITYAPSASSIRFLHAMETPVDGGALVVGDPPQSGLFYATEEAEKVAEAFRVTPHLADKACETLLYGLNHSIDLVHLSTHGVYDGESPMDSYIALAPCGEHDGKLKAKEIAESVDLRGVNLVVLSACNTATGKPTGGDEILGLTRALLSAGTPGVISTLWNVDDLASMNLMTTFYAGLLEGRSAADALRSAQLDMLRRGGEHAAPSYWAAYSLHGDPQARWSRRSDRRDAEIVHSK